MATVSGEDRVLSRSASVVAGRILGSTAAILFSLAIARIAGAAATGEYFLALGIVSVLVVGIQWGMETLVVPLAAPAWQAGRQQDVEAVRSAAYRTCTSRAVVAIVVTLVASPVVSQVFGVDDLVSLMAFGAAFQALASLTSRLLVVVDRLVLGTWLEMVLPPLVMLATFLAWPGPASATRAALAYTVGNAVYLLSVLVVWRVAFGRWPGGARPAPVGRRGRAIAATNLFAYAGDNLDIVLLGPFVPASAIAVLGIGVRAARLLAFLVEGVNISAAPRLAGLVSRGDVEELVSLTRRMTKGLLAIAAVATIVCAGAAGPAMRFLGDDFAGGGPIVFTVCLAAIVNVATGPVGLLLKISGNEHQARRNAGVGVLLQLGVFATLVPFLGVLGAAIARVTNALAANGRSARDVRERLDVDLTPWAVLTSRS